MHALSKDLFLLYYDLFSFSIKFNLLVFWENYLLFFFIMLCVHNIMNMLNINYEAPKPTWVGLVVLAWDLGVCSSLRPQVRFSLVPIWGVSLASSKKQKKNYEAPILQNGWRTVSPAYPAPIPARYVSGEYPKIKFYFFKK